MTSFPDKELAEAGRNDRHRRKAVRMMAWTVALLVGFVVLFVIFVPAGFLEFRLSVLLKLGAGVLATILLAAGLMAASFYSDSSGHDDDSSTL